MSKTSASVYCETNQMRGLPQENIFLQNLYRLPADYSSTFRRSATSTSPVQICAVASAQGDDTLGAMALQEVMKILSGISGQAQNKSVLDFETFLGQFINAANSAVCNLSVTNHGAPIRVSVTILIIEGDTMRIVSIGNTRAVLIRQGRIIPLSEDQTVAHRYVQVGAIPAEAENAHPEANVLTQYIGRFAQDGPIIPEKQIFIKLAEGDEICLLGTGITTGLSDAIRNSILATPASSEQKTAELVRQCIQNNVRGGLTVLLLRVENTMLMPAGAFVPGTGTALTAAGAPTAAAASAVNQFPSADESSDESAVEIPAAVPADPNERAKARKKAKMIAVMRPIGVFLGCILVGYFGLMILFNVGNLMKPSSSPVTDANGSAAVLNKVMYVTADMVALYATETMDTAPTLYLSRGDVVILHEVAGSLSKVTTNDNVTGYIVSSMLSESDPTIGESLPEMSADPTPIPSQEQTAVTTSGPSETTPTTTETTNAPTNIPTNTPTPVVSETTAVSPTPAETTISIPTPAETTATTETTLPPETVPTTPADAAPTP